MVRLAAVAAVSLVLTGAAGGGATSMSGWFVLEGGTISCPNWLVCKNRAGSGWWLGRLRGYRLITPR